MNAAHLQTLVSSMAGASISATNSRERVAQLGTNSEVLHFAAKYSMTQNSHLDTLNIGASSLTQLAAEALESFLRGPARSLSLKYLYMTNPEALLGSHPDLTSAFAGLTSFTHLDIANAGQRSREFLRALKAKLTSVKLAMVPIEDDLGEDDERWDATGRNPITLLSNFQDTLESLTAEGIETLCVEETTYPQRYPKVERIFFEGTDLPVTVHYIHAYPNLSALRIRTDLEEFAELLRTDPAELETRRKVNIIEQLQHGGAWPSLASCESTLGTLYVMGLQCHVHDLRILADIASPPAMLSSVLADTRPVVLTLHQFFLGMLSGPGFAAAMRAPAGVRNLQTLDITLVLDENSGKGAGIEAAFDAMINALEPLKIRALGLMLMCNFPGTYPRETGAPRSSATLTPEEAYLRDLKLDELAERLRDTVRSLNDVVVVMVAHRTRDAAAAVLGENNTELWAFQMASLYGLLPGTAARL